MANTIQTSLSLVTKCVTLLCFSISFVHAGAPAQHYEITVNGGNEASFTPPSSDQIIKDPKIYDSVIIGGGLAGLSAAVYLTDHRRQVLILDKESTLGGLAAGGSTSHHVRYDRGAAYWTDTFPEEQEILKHIGLGDFHHKYAIHEPADSFYWKGELYLGIWENETLEKLPASFSVFKFMLKKANDKGLIPNQPFEDADNLSLDDLTAAAWIRSMPEGLKSEAEHGNREALALVNRFEKDSKVNHHDPMADVIELIDLYCRSALGATSDKVSAVAFANFYVSEIETRYTTPVGTGGAAELMVRMLGRRRNASARTGAAVTKIQNTKDGVLVKYNFEGKSHEVVAKTAVFAAQLSFAPRIIEGFADTEQARMMGELKYANYSVHALFVKGHPYRATYDTWVRARDYSEDDFTDVILGRWMDPSIRGYEGIREFDATGHFKKKAPDNDGIITIYHPLPPRTVGHGYDDETAKQFADRAVGRFLELWPPTVDGRKAASSIEIERVETNRWPFSVHVAAPGHFRRAKVLRRPFGKVFFANNNLGTPAFEEALFRGHCAADRILKTLDPKFRFERWTRCSASD